MDKPQPPDDLWRQLDEIQRETVGFTAIVPDGKGWFNIADYANRYQLNNGMARARLNKLVRAGKLETGLFTMGQAGQPQRYYRIIKEG